VIGLTGGIGSGKSTVSACSPSWARASSTPTRSATGCTGRAATGSAPSSTRSAPSVVAADGTIDRARLGAIVFADADARARLNAIVHPLIGAELAARIAAARDDGYEGRSWSRRRSSSRPGWRAIVDQLWGVSVRRERRSSASSTSRGLSRADVERRLDTQLSDAERRRQADVVIENDGGLEGLRAQVEAAWRSVSGLTLALGVVLARAALAADPCQEGRLHTGVAVSGGPAGVAIASVDDDSPAAGGGLRAATASCRRTRACCTSCDDWARALREARRDRKALLLLVPPRRGGGCRSCWRRRRGTRVVAVAPPTVPTVPPSPPTVPPVPSTVPPLPAHYPPPRAKRPPPPTATTLPPPPTAPSVAAIVKEPAAGAPSAPLDELLRSIAALTPTSRRPPASAPTSSSSCACTGRSSRSRARRGIPGGDHGPPDRRALLRRGRGGVGGRREPPARSRRNPRHFPSSEGSTAPYFANSDAEATIVEFPFLRETVAREPGTGTIEVSGLWRPIQARALLWEKGREQLDRLAEWVRAGR
jgi:dephospho-CoA kinase